MPERILKTEALVLMGPTCSEKRKDAKQGKRVKHAARYMTVKVKQGREVKGAQAGDLLKF